MRFAGVRLHYHLLAYPQRPYPRTGQEPATESTRRRHRPAVGERRNLVRVSESGGPVPGLDAFKFRLEPAAGGLGVIGCFGAQPVAVQKSEEPAEAQIGIGRHASAAKDNLADALGGDARLFCLAVLGNAEGSDELLLQELPRG